MKSVCESGRLRLTIPSPGPRPNQEPETKTFERRLRLEIGRHAADRLRRLEKGVDAGAHMRGEFIGEQRPGGADAAKAADPDPVQAGHEEQGAPDDRDQHGLAEIGLQHQRADGGRQQRQRDQIAGHVLAPRAFRKRPRRRRR